MPAKNLSTRNAQAISRAAERAATAAQPRADHARRRSARHTLLTQIRQDLAQGLCPAEIVAKVVLTPMPLLSILITGAATQTLGDLTYTTRKVIRRIITENDLHIASQNPVAYHDWAENGDVDVYGVPPISAWADRLDTAYEHAAPDNDETLEDAARALGIDLAADRAVQTAAGRLGITGRTDLADMSRDVAALTREHLAQHPAT